MTEHQYLVAKDVLLYMEYILLPLSLVVTIINIVVFFQPSMRSATSRYVLGISFAQIVYLLFSVISHTLSAADLTQAYGYTFYFLYLGIYGGAFVRRGTYVVTCLMSAERLYAVVRPLHVREFILVRHPVPFICSSYILVAAYHVYIVLKYEIASLVTSTGTRYILKYTDIYLDNREGLDNMGVWAKVLFSYTPLVILVAFNLLTLFCLRRHNARRRGMKTTSDEDAANKRERQMSVTIVTATACYVLLSLPLAIHSVLIVLAPDYNMRGRESSVYFMMEDFSYVCTLVSYSTDFVSFVMLSTSFRLTLLRLLHIQQGRQAHDKTAITSITNAESS
nr:hypothetical protein BaRGS_030638 [Batillaria attramentaria]